MSADGAAMRAASSLDGTMVRRDASSDLTQTGASAHPREVDGLRNSLSAVMVEYHEQSKNFTAVTADHARQSQEIAALRAERDELRSKYRELERRVFDIES